MSKIDYNIQLYPWLSSIYQKILNSYRVGKGHNVLIFHNKWNNGEEILINAIIRWLICSCPNKLYYYCNVCSNCQLMNFGNYPDYYKFNLEKDSKSIGINLIHDCIDRIYNHSYQGQIKVVFIKHVEYLTIPAVNALLKIIEEPPINTFFFFRTKKYEKMPYTLLSRCISWSISFPTESFSIQWLTQNSYYKNDVLLIKSALRLCGGFPIETKIMLESNLWKQRMQLCIVMRRIVMTKDFFKILSLFNISQKNNMLLFWLITLIADALKWKKNIKEEFMINIDQIDLISIISNFWSTYYLNNQLQKWLELFFLFQEFKNINRELLLIHRLLN